MPFQDQITGGNGTGRTPILPLRPFANGGLDACPEDMGTLFASALELMPTGVLVVRRDGGIVFANREAEQLFKYPRRELVSCPIETLFPDGTKPIAERADVFGLRRDGSRFPVELRLTPIDKGHDVIVLASVVAEPRHDGNVYPRQKADPLEGSSGIVGQSPAVKRVLEQVRQVAGTDSTVLLLGETGVGKEVFAAHIHQLSARRGRAMVRVNCAAIPATLLESELFGRERGAFTGALSQQVGRFELADHSTIFLDEIGDLPLDVQVKLLRVLEERQIERLGSPRTIRVDTRIVAATHRNLEQSIGGGSFREDLFYRLNVFPIRVPPLRDRAEDIPLLVWRFVNEFSKAFGKRVDAIPRDTMEALQRYLWPGNVRELRNVVERAMIVATGPELTIPLPSAGTGCSEGLLDVETEHIRRVLESVSWRIRGTRGAAERLGMKPTTLETRLAKLGLKRPPRPQQR